MPKEASTRYWIVDTPTILSLNRHPTDESQETLVGVTAKNQTHIDNVGPTAVKTTPTATKTTPTDKGA